MTARFAVGDRVRIDDRFEARHHRVPAYVKGRTGVVERLCLPQGQPELFAELKDGKPFQPVYRVRLDMPDLWQNYAENPADTLDVEIFEHWLTPAGEED